MCQDCACAMPGGTGQSSPLADAQGAAPVSAAASGLRTVIRSPATATVHDATRPEQRREPALAGPLQTLSLGRQLLERNAALALANRHRFETAGVQAVNLLSSPGSGKTALLEALARLATAASPPPRLAALVGDLATELDARRLEAAGLPAVALTTGQACHLDAALVARGLEALEARGLPLASLDLLLIENVGNLVCPAAYDLGEQRRVVLLAVGEGEDKPLKYPASFHSADLVVLSKLDLAEAVGFDQPQALATINAVAPRAEVQPVSARSGAGLEALLARLLAPRP